MWVGELCSGRMRTQSPPRKEEAPFQKLFGIRVGAKGRLASVVKRELHVTHVPPQWVQPSLSNVYGAEAEIQVDGRKNFHGSLFCHLDATAELSRFSQQFIHFFAIMLHE